MRRFYSKRKHRGRDISHGSPWHEPKKFRYWYNRKFKNYNKQLLRAFTKRQISENEFEKKIKYRNNHNAQYDYN